MKKKILNFSNSLLSREQMKGIKGGDALVEGSCTKKCSISGDCAAAASGNGCECSTNDGGTC